MEESLPRRWESRAVLRIMGRIYIRRYWPILIFCGGMALLGWVLFGMEHPKGVEYQTKDKVAYFKTLKKRGRYKRLAYA